MATQVTLKVKDQEGNVKNEKHEIEDINLLQFEQTMKVVKDIFVQIQEDEALKEVFADLFHEGDADEQDARFLSGLVNSFETLAVHVPAKAIQLLSVLSGVEINKLQNQKMMDVFEIYDAVIDENDLEKLWKRAKKSLVTTKAKMTFVNLKQKATQKAQA